MRYREDAEVISMGGHANKTPRPAADSPRSEREVLQIIEEYTPFVRSRANFYAGKGAEADDLFQEGMIGLINAIYRFDSGYHVPFTAFAKVCVDNKILAAVKRAGRLNRVPLDDSVPLDEADEALSDEKALQHLVETKEQVERVKEKIELHLTKMERDILMLHLQGYSYEEIAGELGLSVKSVSNALYRVRKKLR